MGYAIVVAVKQVNAWHSGEIRNPGKDWMPDQVRHDRWVLYLPE
jgi:hypothetical protein